MDSFHFVKQILWEMDTEMYLHTCLPQFFLLEITLDVYKQVSSLWYRVKTLQKQAKPHRPHFKNTDTELFRILSTDQTHAIQGQDRTYQRQDIFTSMLQPFTLQPTQLLKYLHLQCYLLAFLCSAGILCIHGSCEHPSLQCCTALAKSVLLLTK